MCLSDNPILADIMGNMAKNIDKREEEREKKETAQQNQAAAEEKEKEAGASEHRRQIYVERSSHRTILRPEAEDEAFSGFGSQVEA